MGNPVCHVDLVVSSTQQSMKFYNKVFDWKFIEEPNSPDLAALDSDYEGELTLSIGGLGQGDSKEMEVLIHVDSMEKTLQKVKDNGGIVLREDIPHPRRGTVAVVQGPDGNRIHIYEK